MGIGIFFRLLLGGAGKILSGFFGGIWRWLCARKPLELLAMALIVVLLVQHFFLLNPARRHLVDERAKTAQLTKQIGEACAAARLAADNPKLDCRQLAGQITALGASLKETTGALNSQNAAIRELARQTAEQQAAAAVAKKKAQVRADQAISTAERLKASAAKAVPPGKECEPSDELKGTWR
jgi:septal ring factor EnvC (AmiA/AmiB activator)